MIGTRYWSTGITIVPDVWPGARQWSAKLTFLDNGFCQADSTEGELRLRYFTDELRIGLETLKQDAERLGIVFECGDRKCGAVYVEQDGELENGDFPDLRGVANEACGWLGWPETYTEAVV